MNRRRPTGWRYESVRHSLAARGITTTNKRYFSELWIPVGAQGIPGVRPKKVFKTQVVGDVGEVTTQEGKYSLFEKASRPSVKTLVTKALKQDELESAVLEKYPPEVREMVRRQAEKVAQERSKEMPVDAVAVARAKERGGEVTSGVRIFVDKKSGFNADDVQFAVSELDPAFRKRIDSVYVEPGGFVSYTRSDDEVVFDPVQDVRRPVWVRLKELVEKNEVPFVAEKVVEEEPSLSLRSANERIAVSVKPDVGGWPVVERKPVEGRVSEKLVSIGGERVALQHEVPVKGSRLAGWPEVVSGVKERVKGWKPSVPKIHVSVGDTGGAPVKVEKSYRAKKSWGARPNHGERCGCEYCATKRAVLSVGAKHEMEHAGTIRRIERRKPKVSEAAEWIADDHVKEFPNYYPELDRMEERLKRRSVK